jgi:hypothetical protein
MLAPEVVEYVADFTVLRFVFEVNEELNVVEASTNIVEAAADTAALEAGLTAVPQLAVLPLFPDLNVFR